jgi:transcription initiation factor IIE alpha subunit
VRKIEKTVEMEKKSLDDVCGENLNENENSQIIKEMLDKKNQEMMLLRQELDELKKAE